MTRVGLVGRTWWLVLTATMIASGCGARGLNFVEDPRLTIVSPADRAEVSLPLTIEWEVTDFAVTGPDGTSSRDAGYFGVFVDRAPQPPGRTLAWLARNDESCVAAQGCPDEAWFDRHDIHATQDTSFTIAALPARPGDQREFHEVTVVLLDGRGQRIGESAWAVEFQVLRGGT